MGKPTNRGSHPLPKTANIVLLKEGAAAAAAAALGGSKGGVNLGGWKGLGETGGIQK